MKICEHCDMKFDTEEHTCPICGAKLRDMDEDEDHTAELVATMTVTDIL